MKFLIDIKDEKVSFVMELLRNFKFVKIKTLAPYDVEMLEGLKDAVDEVNLVKAGKKKAKPLTEFLDEL